MMIVYSWPAWLVLVVEVAFVAGLAVLGQLVVRRMVPAQHLAKHNDVTGFVLAIVGVIYAVLLAFIVVVAWEGYNTAEETVRAEASAASDLYRVVGGFPEPARGQIRRDILGYAELVQTKEWDAMQRGEETPEARDAAERIGAAAMTLADAGWNAKHQVSAASIATVVRAFVDSRRQRLNINGVGIPGALWRGLILGAMLTIGFTYLFGVENHTIQTIITALLGSLIAVMFSMIVVLDYPFRGPTRVMPEPWHAMTERIAAEHLTP